MRLQIWSVLTLGNGGPSNGFRRSSSAKEILAWIEASFGNSTNKTGLQGAHIIAKKLWADLGVSNLLGLGDETNLNGVLAAETTSGGSILGYGTHRGSQWNDYDRVFFNPIDGANDFRYFNGWKSDLEAELASIPDDSPLEGQIKALHAS